MDEDILMVLVRILEELEANASVDTMMTLRLISRTGTTLISDLIKSYNVLLNYYNSKHQNMHKSVVEKSTMNFTSFDFGFISMRIRMHSFSQFQIYPVF